jgi:hypothetical protein
MSKDSSHPSGRAPTEFILVLRKLGGTQFTMVVADTTLERAIETGSALMNELPRAQGFNVLTSDLRPLFSSEPLVTPGAPVAQPLYH